MEMQAVWKSECEFAPPEYREGLSTAGNARLLLAYGITDVSFNGRPYEIFVATEVQRAPSTGTFVVSYYSVDNVDNKETIQTSTIVVSTSVFLDTQPPRTALLVSSPSFISALTVPSSTTFATSRTTMTLSSIDDLSQVGDGVGLGVAFQSLSIDGSTPMIFTDTSPGVGKIFNSSFTLATSSDGLHILDYFAQDIIGNREAVHIATIAVDNTPPVSSISIGQPQFALSTSTLLVSSRTLFSISAIDPVVNGVASGVKNSFFSVNGASFAVYAGSFTLIPPDGPQTVSFYSVDNVLNAEIAKSTGVVLDSTPPNAVLLSPSPGDGGVCSVFNGKFPVIGTVSDLHFANYILDFAPGQNASTGFTMISSGTVAISSGTLGIWDTSALSGWQTLRLTASDLVDNVTVSTMSVFVGSPSLLLSLQGKRQKCRIVKNW